GGDEEIGWDEECVVESLEIICSLEPHPSCDDDDVQKSFVGEVGKRLEEFTAAAVDGAAIIEAMLKELECLPSQWQTSLSLELEGAVLEGLRVVAGVSRILSIENSRKIERTLVIVA
ncbi:hypothetical protein TSMEX_010908, partial [Taenia solium]